MIGIYRLVDVCEADVEVEHHGSEVVVAIRCELEFCLNRKREGSRGKGREAEREEGREKEGRVQVGRQRGKKKGSAYQEHKTQSSAHSMRRSLRLAVTLGLVWRPNVSVQDERRSTQHLARAS